MTSASTFNQSADLHGKILSSYDIECQGDWALGPNDGYYFQFLLYHIINSRGIEAAFEVFSDIDWLLAKWRAAGGRSMLADCEYFRNREIAQSVRSSVLDFSNNVNPSDLARVLKTPRALSRFKFMNTGPQSYILVAGTGRMHLSDPELLASETIGCELARAGLGLITGGWQGVDHIVCREYVTQLRRDQISSNGKLIHVVPGGTTPDLWTVSAFAGEGDLDFADDTTNASQRSVQRANAVVMIGGIGGTREIYEYATRLGKPVYPIAATGGDAASAFDEVFRAAPQLQHLERNINSRRDARDIAMTITDMQINSSEASSDILDSSPTPSNPNGEDLQRKQVRTKKK